MTKPVLYLTNNLTAALKAVNPQTQRLEQSTARWIRGIYKSGDAFLIVDGMDLENAQRIINSIEFSRFEVIGEALPDVIAIAQTRVRP